MIAAGQVYKTRDTVVTIDRLSEDGVIIFYTESFFGVKHPAVTGDVTRPKFEDWAQRVGATLQDSVDAHPKA